MRFTKKTEYINWDSYIGKIRLLEILNFQQKIRKYNLKNIY